MDLTSGSVGFFFALGFLAGDPGFKSAVSICGLIGWVGLLVPHAARMLFGSANERVLPACLLLGGLFLLLIDTAARSLSEAEIPVSILTAIVGAPVFILLLRRTGGRFG